MDLIEIGATEKEQIRKYFQVNEVTIKEDIDRIKTWMSKQPHLPQDLTDDFIEKILLRNKFRVEKTKQKLDNYYTLRGTNRDLVKNFESIVPSQHITTYLLLPKLTPNCERVVLVKLNVFDPEQYDISEAIRINLATTHLTLQYDYCLGVRYVWDLEGWTLKHVLRANPIILLKYINLFEQAYSGRILGIEIVNPPAFVTKTLAIVKLVVKPKIYERVRVHKDVGTMHEIIPKECLPKEYGGISGTVPNLLEKWDKVMMEHKLFFLESYNNVSREHLRLNQTRPNDSFGIDGTFKQLQLD